MRIHRLSEGTINRIAAGEVIERPASAVKELVENAIDAGARQIDVVFRGGGKTLIRVSDDGHGMGADDLVLAVERHATSKLSDDDLTHIATMGFRGEALPSIGSVARLTITSRARGSDAAFSISVEGGRKSDSRPASLKAGTEAEIRDLFFATPARLKFLKTDRSETTEALDVMRRLALANPAIGFSFASEERRWLDCPPGETREQRIAQVLGREFIANAVPVQHAVEDIVVEGLAGLPTAARAQATQQFAFVNGRPVRDKLIAGAIRGAYADVLPPGRFPALALYITCAPERVDVNVHPAKAEVRFRDQSLVRNVIVSGIRRALTAKLPSSDVHLGRETAAAFRSAAPFAGGGNAMGGFAEARQAAFEMNMPPTMAAAPAEQVSGGDQPLGYARAQLHGNYIVAQTATGVILVDQHAAHERIVYERLKREREGQGVTTQPLLVPEVVELDPGTMAAVLSVQELLATLGLAVESFGAQSLLVREVPAALGQVNMPALLKAIADEAAEWGTASTLSERANHALATFACHHSVRANRPLRIEEMDALLRQMEVTPNAGQCNHGRPTFIELKLGDIERLFGRS
ncbi:MAG: DNA mismatch repair endonuclease MutL [Proteobacteria bacterium]|nr:DNA mismatch repair endonuclease MutL [Pseudomonadota bacterium]